MGTHPIFESDFDCLTDLNRLQWLHRSQKHSKRSARRTKPNSQNALWRNKTRSAQTFSSDAPSPSALRSTRRSMPSPTVSKSRASGRRRQTATCTCLPSPNSPSSFEFRGINQVSPRVKKILQLLRLRQIGNTTFVKLNKA